MGYFSHGCKLYSIRKTEYIQAQAAASYRTFRGTAQTSAQQQAANRDLLVCVQADRRKMAALEVLAAAVCGRDADENDCHMVCSRHMARSRHGCHRSASASIRSRIRPCRCSPRSEDTGPCSIHIPYFRPPYLSSEISPLYSLCRSCRKSYFP